MNQREFEIIADIIYGNNELIEQFADRLEDEYKSFNRLKFMLRAGYRVRL